MNVILEEEILNIALKITGHLFYWSFHDGDFLNLDRGLSLKESKLLMSTPSYSESSFGKLIIERVKEKVEAKRNCFFLDEREFGYMIVRKQLPIETMARIKERREYVFDESLFLKQMLSMTVESIIFFYLETTPEGLYKRKSDRDS